MHKVSEKQSSPTYHCSIKEKRSFFSFYTGGSSSGAREMNDKNKLRKMACFFCSFLKVKEGLKSGCPDSFYLPFLVLSLISSFPSSKKPLPKSLTCQSFPSWLNILCSSHLSPFPSFRHSPFLGLIFPDSSAFRCKYSPSLCR